jgi:hypothetical protein
VARQCDNGRESKNALTECRYRHLPAIFRTLFVAHHWQSLVHFAPRQEIDSINAPGNLMQCDVFDRMEHNVVRSLATPSENLLG